MDIAGAPPGGRGALVFGGSRGIGAAAVRRLAADGHAVAFTYLSQAARANALVASIEAAGGTALAIQADSANPDAVRQAVSQAVDGVGALGVLVVNAGVLRLGTIDAVPLEDLDLMLDVNVRGVFLAIQAAVPHLRDGARVITIGGSVAVRSGMAGASVHQLTKCAVAGLVKGVALDLARRGITVNNIQPGPTETDAAAGAPDMLAKRSPLGRVARPEEIAGLVSYLARDEARHMTGASLTIDGGLTL